MEKVRFGIAGLGNMGTGHMAYLARGEVKGAELTAICDDDPAALRRAAATGAYKAFESAEAMVASGEIDAIIIATPHYLHPDIAIKAFAKGLHVMTEKPAGVYTKQVRLMDEAAAASGKVFGIMFSTRPAPIYQKMKELISAGEIGAIIRTNWIITNWYRTQSYYDSGGWRATWAGEGGGVLLNQDPHQLDIWQWTCGLPKRVMAFCGYGKFHEIEVEDDVTAYVEYEGGATGVFVTSTGETPGTNRFEISGDLGKILVENGKLRLFKLRSSSAEFLKTSKSGFAQPECWECLVPVHGQDGGHAAITQNFVDAILKGAPLMAPGYEGMKGLQISNAMHLSCWTGKWADIPVDEELFLSLLNEKVKGSKAKSGQKGGVGPADLSSSFNKS